MAILTDAFAPFSQVGLAQGCFQLTAAMGTVLGPLVGGVSVVARTPHTITAS